MSIPRALLDANIKRLAKRLDSEATDELSVRRYHELFAQREDSAKELVTLAASLSNGHAAGAALVRGILRGAEQDEPSAIAGPKIPHSVDSRFGMLNHVQESWQLLDDWDGLEETLQAYDAFDGSRRQKVLTKILDSHCYAFAWLLLHRIPEDAPQWDQALSRLAEWQFPSSQISLGIGLMSTEQLKKILGVIDELPEGEAATAVRLGILAWLARAARRGEAWPEELDARATIDAVWSESSYLFASYAAPLLRAIVEGLPTERRDAWFDAQLGTPLSSSFTRLLLVVPPGDLRLVERLVDLLASNARLVKKPAFDWLSAFIAQVGRDAAAFLPKLAKKKKLRSAFEAGLASAEEPPAARREAEHPADGATTPKPEPRKAAAIAKLEKLAQEVAKESPRTTIYALEQLATPRRGSLSRLGGPGFDLGERHPSYDGLPMSHILTLDLAELPELAPRLSRSRAVALYLSEAQSNNASEPDTEEAAVVELTTDDVAREAPGEGALPLQGIRLTAIGVPTAALSEEGARSPMGRAIAGLAARAGGTPTWLQEIEYGEEGFLLQFDDRFAAVNLGDAGVMYVFSDTAFWQSR